MSKASQERLDRMRARMQQTKTYASQDYWKPDPDTMYHLRILPEKGGMGYFWQDIGRHYVDADSNKLCPLFTSDGEEECPVCDAVEFLKQGTAEDRAYAKKLYVRRSFHMNVLVRKVVKDEELPFEGPVTYTPGIMVLKQIEEILGDEEFGDITDVEEGMTLKLKRTGSGMDTKYNLLPSRRSSALMSLPMVGDYDSADAVLGAAKDLSTVLNNLPLPEDLIEAFGLETFMDIADGEDFDEDREN